MSETVRIICQCTDATAAAHVGGPVATEFRTFEVDAPEVVAWFRAQGPSIGHKTVVGVEIPQSKEPTP